VNKPLSFELKLDRKHAFLKSRIKDGGLDKKLVKAFGLGFASKGMMTGRVCFPIHNEAGELIAYSGRWASDSLPKDVPRYLLPKGFEKSKVLFNLNRIIRMRDSHPDIDTVVIVEGFWSVMRLHGLGIPCVSSFGDSVSADQVELLIQNGFRSAILIFDGDEGGRTGTEQSLPLLAEKLFTKVIHLEDGIKPDVMDKQLVSELPRYLTTRVRVATLLLARQSNALTEGPTFGPFSLARLGLCAARPCSCVGATSPTRLVTPRLSTCPSSPIY